MPEKSSSVVTEKPVADGEAEETQEQRNQGAIALIQQWLAEAPNEEDERWPELEAALEENRRSSGRRLFGG